MQQGFNIINWPIYQMIDTLREFFGQQTRDNFQFSDDEAYTRVLIREKNAVKLDSPDDRPMLVVSRGTIRTQNRYIADRHSIDGTTGLHTYLDIIETQITVDCLSPRGLEAEALASMVFGMVKHNREYIIAKGFLRIDPPVISEEQIILVNSDYDLINVSVVFSVVYAIKWINREKDTPILDGIVYRAGDVNVTRI